MNSSKTLQVMHLKTGSQWKSSNRDVMLCCNVLVQAIRFQLNVVTCDPCSLAQCLPGQFSASGLNLPGSLTPCESCPNNTYQDKLGQSRCERCPNDTETLTSGSTSVSDCGGKYWEFVCFKFEGKKINLVAHNK